MSSALMIQQILSWTIPPRGEWFRQSPSVTACLQDEQCALRSRSRCRAFGGPSGVPGARASRGSGWNYRGRAIGPTTPEKTPRRRPIQDRRSSRPRTTTFNLRGDISAFFTHFIKEICQWSGTPIADSWFFRDGWRGTIEVLVDRRGCRFHSGTP